MVYPTTEAAIGALAKRVAAMLSMVSEIYDRKN